MILEHLSICNYGVYAGNNNFELATTSEKPIILIGGINGAGKTTILESIMIALYGRTYFGTKKTKAEYLKFIRNRIHKSNKKRANYASVEIIFMFYHNGSEDRYKINRRWDMSGASVTESFSIQKNSEPMNDIDESQWQVFIEGLLPLGIAKLFFFDGEKIVKVAENKGEYNKEIKTSVETLIGADLVHRLHADLNLYILRKSGNKNDSMDKEYKEVNREKNQLVQDIKIFHSEKERKILEIEEWTRKIGTKESMISVIGGGYSDKREHFLTQKAVITEKTRHHTKQLQDVLSENAPFYLVPSMLNRVNHQLEEDSKVMHMQAVSKRMSILLPEMKEKMTKFGFRSDGKDGIHKLLDMLAEVSKGPIEEVFFDLSADDAAFLSVLIREIKQGHKSITDMASTLADMTQQLENVELEITRIPRDDEIGPRIKEINEMYQEIGILKSELEHINQQIASKTAYKKILQNKLKKIIDSIHSNKKASTGVQLASKMQDVLEAYYANLKRRKILELESNLLYTVKLLLHKKSIRKIKIDEDTFEIKTYRDDDEPIPGDFLSMGEKQIVGTALLWAIARTCGRSLPFVIDTPIGRLDSQHSVNLTENFYPVASHQMVLLSTDREIMQREYDKLSESISESYKITCNKDTSVTSVMPGYFTEDELAQVR